MDSTRKPSVLKPSKKRKSPFKSNEMRYIKKVANDTVNKKIETKYKDTNTGSLTDYNGTVFDCSAIAVGTTDSTRVGDQVYLRSIQLRANSIVADNTNVVRIIVFQWYPDSTPTVNLILQSAYVGSVNLPNAPYAHDYRHQYKILVDRRLSLDGNGQQQLVVQQYVTKNFTRKIQYAGGTTTGSNKIYVITCSDSSVAVHPTVNMIVRLKYNDS